MNPKIAQALKELRNILDLTQGEFAVMIGASKDAVASWEVSRNNLSPSFARRIALATGVEAEDLLRGRMPLMTRAGGQRRPFTAETYKAHRASYWGSSDEAAARRHIRHCSDALELLFQAASQTATAKGASRLPAVVGSFIQWCEETRENFQLEKAVDEQLNQRKARLALNKTYKQWRTHLKEDPAACRALGFKDDPKKRDDEYLRLETELVPIWKPGYSMRAQQKES